MAAGEQTSVIEFLASPAAHGGAAVERIDTHTAIVFLAGPRALKLKRAVAYDYFDASTSERRRSLCEAEVALNRRTAPDLYRGVLAVTREPGGALALGGRGEPVDWVIDMRRFDQEALFDRLAEAGRLDLALMAPLAEAIAAFHREATPRPEHGGAAGMRWVIEGNAAAFDEAACLETAAGRRVSELARAELARRAALLDERRAGGFVRQCHGDLHLRNLVLLEGRPTLFDAIEFNDRIACIDVLYDFAFLLMDLWRRGLPRHANAVWNRYLLRTVDLAAEVLPLFLSCRAAVRAKTSAAAARFQTDAHDRHRLEAAAREYLATAERLLQPGRPCLIAVGGRSGSGKSTLALAVAPEVGAPPGAVVLRSDEIRKQLLKKPLLEPLGPEGYAGWVSMRVYDTMAKRARRILDGGHSVIVDAVFSGSSERKAIEAVAVSAGVPFVGLWLEAPPDVLIARASARERDVSDADADVVRRQLARSPGRIVWHRLDTSGSAGDVLAQTRARLRDAATA